MADKFELFIKLMMLSTSDQDGEALAALRKANAVLAEANMNWEELIRAKAKAEIRPDERPATGVAEPFIEEMLEELLRDVKGSFRDFIVSISEWYDKHGSLTPKQYAAIKKAWDKRNP